MGARWARLELQLRHAVEGNGGGRVAPLTSPSKPSTAALFLSSLPFCFLLHVFLLLYRPLLATLTPGLALDDRKPHASTADLSRRHLFYYLFHHTVVVLDHACLLHIGP